MVQVLIIRSHSLVGTFIRSRDDKLYVELKERKKERTREKLKTYITNYQRENKKKNKAKGSTEIQKKIPPVYREV